MPDPGTANGNDLYVGYLPVPPRHRRFLRVAVPAALWLVCAASVLFAWSQRSPGTAAWESAPVTISGTLMLSPYPILIGDDGTPVLLVEMGKHGAQRRLAAMDGKRVSATGWPLHRDGRRMLELDIPESAVAAAPGEARPALPAARAPVTLRGEIVDAKCYLGAMKPGEGRTHKECATLCIKGGLPAMLVYSDADGRRRYALLAAPDGGPPSDELLPLVADPVQIEGDLETLGAGPATLEVVTLRSLRRL